MVLANLGLPNLNPFMTQRQNIKIHDCTQDELDSDYFFEAIGDGTKAYMTSQGRSVRQGEYILLQTGTKVEKYKIEQVDYYCNPSDMWIALLSKDQT